MNNWSCTVKGCFINILLCLLYLIVIFIWFPYGFLTGLAVLLLKNRSHFSNFYFNVFYLICLSGLWLGFQFSVFIGLGVFLIMLQGQKKKKELKEYKQSVKKQLEIRDHTIRKPTRRQKIKEEFKKRLKKNNKPDNVENYKGCKIKIYYLSKKKRAFKIVNWDNITLKNIFYNIRAAKNAIGRIYPTELTKEEYFAEKERKLRKQEQDKILARAYQRRQKASSLKKNLITIDSLLNLTPTEFEKWVKNNILEKEGWKVKETKATGDGGIDFILNRPGEHSIAQCKRFKKTVGEPLLRDFYGTMMSEGVSKGYFVTTGLFSLSALKFAEDKPIEMIDRRVLAQKYL